MFSIHSQYSNVQKANKLAKRIKFSGKIRCLKFRRIPTRLLPIYNLHPRKDIRVSDNFFEATAISTKLELAWQKLKFATIGEERGERTARGSVRVENLVILKRGRGRKSPVFSDFSVDFIAKCLVGDL